jgi:hypothetical protein
MKPYHLTPKRAAKRALKEKMAKDEIHRIGEHGAVGWLNKDGSRTCAECGKPIKELYISKHTPKEQAAVFRKINQIIKFLKGGEK